MLEFTLAVVFFVVLLYHNHRNLCLLTTFVRAKISVKALVYFIYKVNHFCLKDTFRAVMNNATCVLHSETDT